MPVVLIPALNPDDRLTELVTRLRMLHPVIVIDDGSRSRSRPVFDSAARAGATVLRHPRNLGKGAALRTGIREAMRRYPGTDIVTADADGQHTVADITRVAAALRTSGGREIVLGARSFTGDVPPRSRLGNVLTRHLYRLVTGQPLTDTQTGLRGYPAAALTWLQELPGDRFEWEFTVLLRAPAAGWTLSEVSIETVYLEQNASSHFRPVVDSVRICAPLLRFAASALLSFLVDTLALLLLRSVTGSLLAAVVGARLISGASNFAVNRSLVFRAGRDVPVRTAAVRYASLAALLLFAGYGLLTALTDIGIPLLAAKILTDLTLFAVSFTVQKAVIFAPAARGAGREPSAGNECAAAAVSPSREAIRG